MSKNIRTHLFCFDDHRIFTEEIKKKFDDPVRYVIHSCQTRDDLINRLKIEKENNNCRIAVIGLHDSREHLELTEQLTDRIRKTDPRTSVIVLCPAIKTEINIQSLNIDASIPLNGSFVLRLHNTVKKLYSEHNIAIRKKRRNKSLMVLLGFLITSVILVIIARIKFPDFF